MSQPLLLEYFQALPQRRDNETKASWLKRYQAGLRRFHQQTGGRYYQGTLERLLNHQQAEVRQAAALALGLLGTMQANEILADRLHDEDTGVRHYAEEALWAIWFRADLPEHNEELQLLLQRIRAHVHPQEILGGFALLLQKAPTFAEAYNQRAVFHFQRGDLARSIADCQKVLKLNPYHFGAASGMAQCYLKQKKYHAALRTFRRALGLNPNLEKVRQTIGSLEKLLGEEGRK